MDPRKTENDNVEEKNRRTQRPCLPLIKVKKVLPVEAGFSVDKLSVVCSIKYPISIPMFRYFGSNVRAYTISPFVFNF